MNTTRLFHFLFQGNLVKRIAVGLVLGILVALVNESVKNSAGIDLASSFGVLGKIFVKAQDVFNIGSAPGVNRLVVIADAAKIAMLLAE